MAFDVDPMFDHGECLVPPDQVTDIYQAFCEAEGGVNHPFQYFWDEYQDKCAEIRSGSLLEALILAAMQYAIDMDRKAIAE